MRHWYDAINGVSPRANSRRSGMSGLLISGNVGCSPFSRFFAGIDVLIAHNRDTKSHLSLVSPEAGRLQHSLMETIFRSIGKEESR